MGSRLYRLYSHRTALLPNIIPSSYFEPLKLKHQRSYQGARGGINRNQINDLKLDRGNVVNNIISESKGSLYGSPLLTNENKTYRKSTRNVEHLTPNSIDGKHTKVNSTVNHPFDGPTSPIITDYNDKSPKKFDSMSTPPVINSPLINEDSLTDQSTEVYFRVSDPLKKKISFTLSSKDLNTTIKLFKEKIYPRITTPFIVYTEHIPRRINKILSSFNVCSKKFIGIDTESIYNQETGVNELRLIQIAIDDLIVLIILTKNLDKNDLTYHMPCLKELLMSDQILKVGIGVNKDCVAIKRFFGLKSDIKGTEIKFGPSDTSLTSISLKDMSAYQLGMYVSKRTIATRDWDQFPLLPRDLVIYAATDAQVSHLLYKSAIGAYESGDKDKKNHDIPNNTQSDPKSLEIKSLTPSEAIQRLSIAYYMKFKKIQH